MPRPRKSIPSYLPHKQTGRARAVWTDQTGQRQFRMLPGAFDSSESRSAFAAFLLEQEAAPHQPNTGAPDGITVANLLLAYLDHAERHYLNHDGTPTSEIYEVKIVLRALRELYADKPVVEFGPLCVKAARQRWINEKRSRTECNRRVAIIKRIFKWAVSEELAPPAVYQAVATVAGLQKGRTIAHEMKPIGPVDDARVDATLPFLNRHVRGLVEFQRLTGCRPGEACSIRRCDIDTGGSMWLYKPPHHKNAHRGKSRVITVGPKAQELLREFFTPDINDFLFNPRRAVEELRSERSAGRKTPRFPSHMTRNVEKRKAAPRRTPSETYDKDTYGVAIDRACDRAFPPPGELAQRDDETHAAWWGKWIGSGKNKRWIEGRLTSDQRKQVKAWFKAHRWHPNQLRHSAATRVRKEFGLEAAQVLLGHSRADVTQIYAEKNEALAATVAAQIG